MTIEVGNVALSFKAGSAVTAGEYVAIQQVLSGGKQEIVLGSGGAATGGTFSINAADKGNVTNLVVPAGVTAIDAASKNSTISVNGDLTNYGSLDVISRGSSPASTLISATDITNEAGAVISAYSIGAQSHSLSSSLPTQNMLTLTATDSVSNAGSIVTTGSLSINTGGNLINASPLVSSANAGSNTASILATGNVNLRSGTGSITNQGAITSTGGNINISSPNPHTDINIVATGGTFSAASGNISVRDSGYQGTANINLSGGNYLSKDLNLYSGGGAITGDVGEVTGSLNTTAAVEHFAADTANLVIGNNTVSGDPTFASTGNITISGVNTFGESVAILARGNITAGDSNASIVDNGNNVTLIAGAAVSVSSGGTINSGTSDIPGSALNISGTSGTSSGSGIYTATVNLGQPTGGVIDLSASNASTIIDTSSTTGAGGSVTLIALSNGTTGGTINLPATSTIITNSTAAAAGSVLIMASANPASAANTISIGNIQASGLSSSANAGQVQIYTQAPNATQLQFSQNGTMTGSITNSTNPMLNAGVSVGSITTAGMGGAGAGSSGNGVAGGAGGNVTIFAGGSIVSSGSINSFGGGGGGAAGIASSTAGAAGNGGFINIESGTGLITIDGDLNSSGGGGGGGNGSAAGGVGGNAGYLVATAPGNVTISGVVLASSGGGGGLISGGGSFGGAGGGGGALAAVSNAGGGGFYGGGAGGAGTNFVSGGGGGGGVFVGGAGGLGTGGAANGTSGAGNTSGSTGTGQSNFGAGGPSAGSVGDATGTSANVLLTGLALSIQGVLSGGSPFSGDSVAALGTGGTVVITNQAEGVGSPLYLESMDLASTVRLNSFTVNDFEPSIPFQVGSFPTTSGSTGTVVSGNTHINSTVWTGPVPAGSYQIGGSITLNEGNGNSYSVGPSSVATPAEYISILQIQSGVQTLLLNGSSTGGGAVAGGSFTVATQNIPLIEINFFPTYSFTALNLPAGVTENVTAQNLIYQGATTVNGTINLTSSSASILINGNTAIGPAGAINFYGSQGGVLSVGGNFTAPGLVLTTPSGATETIVVTGSITINGNVTSAAAVAGGNLNLIAGGDFYPGNDLLYLVGGSALQITGSVSTNGGNFVATAAVGIAGNYPTVGSITVSGPINTGTNTGTGANGSVILIADNSINTGTITTSGLSATGGGGSVTIIGGKAVLTNNQDGEESFPNGVCPSNFLDLTPPVLTNATINVTGITTAGAAGVGGIGTGASGSNGGNAGSITISTGSYMNIGSIQAFGGGGGGGGSNLSGSGGNGGTGGLGGIVSLYSNGSTIQVSQNINASGGDGGGGGGAGNTGGTAGNGEAGGSAGSFTATSSGGSIVLSGLVLAAAGGDGGNGTSSSGYNGGGGGGSFGGGGGGGSAGAGAGGAGGGGYVTAITSLSGGGGGSASSGGDSMGGSGGGFTISGLAAGSGGTGSGGTGGSGTSTAGGPGSTGAVGGSGSSGGGGAGGDFATSPASSGGNISTSATAVDGSISLSAHSVSLTSTQAATTIYGGSVDIVTFSTTSFQTTYLADADYGANTNTYASGISIGTLQVGANIEATGTSGALVVNNVVETSPLAPGSYQIGGVNITESNNPLVITGSSKITAAEYLAMVQVESTGTQSIVLSGMGLGQGVAVSGNLSIQSANIPAGNFSNIDIPQNVTANVGVSTLTATGFATINGTINFSATNGTLSSGGATTIGGTVNFNGALPNGIGTGSITSGGALTITGAVSAPQAPLTMTATTGNVTVGGNISANSISLTTSASTASILLTGGSIVASGGNVNLTSGATGQISLTSGSLIQGNSVIMATSQVTNNGTIQAGSATGNSIQVNNAAGPLTLNGSGSWISPLTLQLTAQGDVDLGTLFTNSQPVTTNNLYISATGGTVSLQTNLLSVSTDSSGDGGTIQIAGDSISLSNNSIPLVFSANGTGSGNGGFVYVYLGSTSAVTIGSGAGNYEITALGGSTSGNGGHVGISTGGDLNVDLTQILIAPNVAATTGNGNGGVLSLTAGSSGTGNLALSNASSITENAVVNGMGGQIILKAPLITYPTGSGAFTLTADGSGTGMGGMVSFTTSSTAALTIGTGAGNLTLNASAGSDGTDANPANGGTVTVSTGGNLTVNPAQINVSPGGVSGTFGTISLTAGTGTGGGTLVVNGALNANGIGNGNGGNITLQSNSKTVFSIDSTGTKNGAFGPLSVDAAGTGTDGAIEINNLGSGGVVIKQAMTAISSLGIISGTGSIALDGNIGSYNANIYLTVNGSGSITAGAKDLITAANLTATSVSGAITFDNVQAALLTANTGPKAPVTIINLTGNSLAVIGATGSTVTVKSQGWLFARNISANTVTLETTTKNSTLPNSSGYIDLEENINATSGNLNVITAGNVEVGGTGGAISSAKNLTITANGSFSKVIMDSGSNLEAGGNLVINAAKSSVAQAIDGMSGSTITATQAVTLTAHGDITVNSISANKTVKVTAYDQIVSTGSIYGSLGVALATTSTKGTNQGSIIVDNVSTGFASTSGGAISIVAAGGTLAVDSSATINANSAQGGKANITIEDKLVTGIGGKITVGAGAQITTSGKNGGSVEISVGTPSATGNKLPSAGGVAFSPGNPQSVIFLGKNGVTFQGGETDVNVIGKGVKVVLSTGALPSSALTINGGSGSRPTTITADPPPGQTLTSAFLPGSISPAAGLPVQSGLGGADFPAGRPLTASQTVQPTPSFETSLASSGGAAVSLLAASGPVVSAIQTGGLFDSVSGAISNINVETFGSGTPPGKDDAKPVEKVPLDTIYLGDLSCESSVRVISDFDQLDVKSGSQLPYEKCGYVAPVLMLSNDKLILATKKGTVVETAFGNIAVGAKSIVLIMVSPTGTAVFNLHDTHKNAVVINVGNKSIPISPGQHVTVAPAALESFDIANPAESVSHRNLNHHDCGGGMQAFTSEFAITAAISNVKALREMIVLNHSHGRHMTSNVLKTAAIVAQINNRFEPYQLFPHPRVNCVLARNPQN